TVLEGGDEASVWQRHDQRTWTAHDRTVVKVSVVPTAIASVLERAGALFAADSAEWWAGGGALGVLLGSISHSSERHLPTISELRRIARDVSGTAVVLEAASSDVRRSVDWSEEVGDSFPLMRSIKARFDPRGTLSPGRGPGGL